MKVKLMLIIPEMCVGGAQRSLAKLSVELSSHAMIFFVVFNRERPIAYPIAGEVFSLDVQSGRGWLRKTWALLQRIRKLRTLKKKLQIDTAISFLEGADYINILSQVGEKVILSIRGSKLHDEIMLGYHFKLRSKVLIPMLYKRADVIVTVNRGIEDELTSYYGIPPSRVQTINNFYNFNDIEVLSNEPRNSYMDALYKNPVLITTGRLAQEKRLPFLIQVFNELKRKRGNVLFIIVGDGPELGPLMNLAGSFSLNVTKDLGFTVTPDILFTGNQENVFKYLNGAAVYLMNSSSEGFPNGMVEALICGVPVVSSDCPYGPREILAPSLEQSAPLSAPYVASGGILMPLHNSTDDIAHWVAAISSILDDKALHYNMSEQGRKRVKEFDKATIISQWVQMIQPKRRQAKG